MQTIITEKDVQAINKKYALHQEIERQLNVLNFHCHVGTRIEAAVNINRLLYERGEKERSERLHYGIAKICNEICQELKKENESLGFYFDKKD
jgi:hypothetical protein